MALERFKSCYCNDLEGSGFDFDLGRHDVRGTMKTNPLSATVAAVPLVVAILATPVDAAFQVRRVSSPGSIDSEAPIAVIASSPFDDSVGRLVDGANYFYAVFDAAGLSLPINVQRNPAAGCLRLSFDDGNPVSAPVSAAASSVSVAPSSIRADGVQAAVATIVPRDATGVPLGRGLALSVDGSLLWPGRLSGAVEDLGDGTYRARIVSSVPGTGRLDVNVEGTLLAVTPDLTYTAPDPNGSLRDLAILRLSDMTALGNRFAGLTAAAGSGTDQADALQHAWDDTADALGSIANGDPTRDDNVIKNDLDRVLRQLAPLLDEPGALDQADVRDLMNDLLDVARLLASHHLGLAEAGCGVCTGGAPRKVCDAAAALDEADAARGAVDVNWSAVVDAYARSVARSIQAEHGC
jgi:hypothetical protein